MLTRSSAPINICPQVFCKEYLFNPVNAGFVERPEYWRYSSVEAYLGKETSEIITVYGSVGD